jgi:hypothetical protein
VSLIVAEVVEKPGFGGFLRISGVDAVNIGPDDEFFGVHDMGDDGAGKIGTVAAERGDAAVGSGTDETGNDGNKAIFEKGQEDSAAARFSFVKMRLGIAESVAGEDKIGRSDGYRGDAGAFQCGGEKTSAEAFAEGREAIREFRSVFDVATLRNLVEEIAAEEMKLAPDAVVLRRGEMEILEHIAVKMDKAFGFIASVSKPAIGESARDREETVGDTLHGGNDDGDIRGARGGADETSCVHHALSSQKRGAAEFKGDNVPPGSLRVSEVTFRCCFHFYLFGPHGSAPGIRWSVSGRGSKEETHRQFRFWRWV